MSLSQLTFVSYRECLVGYGLLCAMASGTTEAGVVQEDDDFGLEESEEEEDSDCLAAYRGDPTVSELLLDSESSCGDPETATA